MNKKLLSLIVCPICKNRLQQVNLSKLRCVHCKKYYPIKHGVPVLVDLDNLPQHLIGQIRYFAPNSKDYGTAKTVETWQRKYEDRLFQSLKTYRGKVLIDDACGSGYVSVEAAKRGMTVLACDLNLSGLIRLYRHAQQLGLSDKIFSVCCSSEEMPIRTNCADAIVANAILEHLPKEKEAIDEITRVTKKNGIAMITVPLAYYLLNPLFLLVNYMHDRKIGHLRRYTKEGLVSRFHAWNLLRVYYTGHTLKVAKTLINIFIPLFDAQYIENEDEKYVSKKLFASNISIIFRKKT